MGLKTTLDLAHGVLASQGVPHALIGGMALSVWGIQRSTADIQRLMETNPALDLARVFLYADLFGERREMERLWTIARSP